jgi:hypothetical protein
MKDILLFIGIFLAVGAFVSIVFLGLKAFIDEMGKR